MTRWRPLLFLALALLLQSAVYLRASPALAWVNEPVIPGVPALFMSERGGAIFVGTPRGVWHLPTASAEAKLVFEGSALFALERGGAIFVGTRQGVWRLATVGAAAELVAEGEAQFVVEKDGAVFVGTRQGVWRLAPTDAVAEFVVGGAVRFVEERDSAIFVGTSRGVWRLAAAGADAELVAEGVAEFVEAQNGTIFVGTSRNVWRLATASEEPELIFNGSALFVNEQGGSIFVGTGGGIWRLATAGTAAELVAGGVAQFAEERGGAIFVGTHKGVWRLATAEAAAELVAGGIAQFVEERGGAIFVGTHKGVWRLATAGAEPEPVVVEGRARFVEERGGAVFVGTRQGVWRLATVGAAAELVAESEAQFVVEKDGAVFVGTRQGVWRLAPTDAEADLVVEGEVQLIMERGAAIFVGTHGGVWGLATASAEAELVVEGKAAFVEERGSLIFVGTDRGLYRVYHARAVVTDFHSGREAAWWEQALSWLLPDTLIGTSATARASYDGPDAGLITVPPHHFEVILAADRARFNERKERDDFIPLEFTQPVPVGFFPTTFNIAIRDRWDNEYEHTLEQLVLPSVGALGILVVAIPPLLMLTALFGAPFSSFCHTTIMNPYVRRFGSFGVVPLVLTLVPPARQHVLKRYRRALLASDDIRGWQDRFVVSEDRFTARAFSERMQEQRRLLIVGVSGVGKTAFLRHLTACLALGKIPLGRIAPLPVYLPLGRNAAVASVEAMVKGQLENLGRLTDDDLVGWLIRHDSFVFLFDGLNEVGKERRDQIVDFVERHQSRNWVVAASQDAHAQQLGHWGAVETMPRLTRAGIVEFLGRHLGEAQAVALVGSLDEAQNEFLSLPQNLELALELAADRKQTMLPLSEETLFRAVFEQQFTAWRKDGYGDFVAVLCAEAYAMLRNRAPADLPSEITAPLLERKLLRQLGDAVYFRHDTLRGYAASLHFANHWAELLEADGRRIDTNWDAMLRFAAGRLFEQDAAGGQVQALMLALVGAAPQRAALLFTSFEQRHAEFARRFRGEFDRAFGEATRGQLATTD